MLFQPTVYHRPMEVLGLITFVAWGQASHLGIAGLVRRQLIDAHVLGLVLGCSTKNFHVFSMQEVSKGTS